MNAGEPTHAARRRVVLPALAITIVTACAQRGLATAPPDDAAPASAVAPSDDAALTAASRVWIDRSEPDADGWRLIYRNRGDGGLRCRANLRWVREHPPHDFLGETEERFELPAGQRVPVVFRWTGAELGPTTIDAEARDAPALAEPRDVGPAKRAEYALVEAERDGLYLICEPVPPGS